MWVTRPLKRWIHSGYVCRFESQQPLKKTQVQGSDSTKVLRWCESPAAVAAEGNLEDGLRQFEKQKKKLTGPKTI